MNMMEKTWQDELDAIKERKVLERAGNLFTSREVNSIGLSQVSLSKEVTSHVVTIQEENLSTEKSLMMRTSISYTPRQAKSVLNIKAKLQLMMEDAIKDRLLRQISRKEQATNMNFAKLELALILDVIRSLNMRTNGVVKFSLWLGGGRSSRGVGNDGSGSGSGVNNGSGSGVKDGNGSGVNDGSESGGRGGGRAGGRVGGRAGGRGKSLAVDKGKAKASVEDGHATKKKRGRPPSSVDGIGIYHKNRGRSERIANMKLNKPFSV
ncbi:hypothetical protein Tco_0843177 [Tanacetum coccineum]|uniref:Uncharacterized protein n=1 Tax=Tanacetum coccineum TaxID=301880 RepID=A0ABQ5B1C0_9ASTR